MSSSLFVSLFGRYAHKVLGLLVLLVSFVGGFLLFGMSQFPSVYAQSWGDYNTENCKEPGFGFGLCVVSNIVGKENKDTGIIQTDLDRVNRDYGEFEPRFKISNTLSDTKTKLASYIEWMAFIGLSAAVALLIYNGLRLVLSPLSEDQAAAVKKRIGYILIGVLLITGFYFVLKVLLSVLVDVIKK